MGASGTRYSLRPLFCDGAKRLMQNSGACCRENAELCLELSTSLRGALATKQSSFSLLRWIASLTLAMTGQSLTVKPGHDDELLFEI
jgi:hypothetical protein